jgi:hypothetical protein
MKRRFFDKDFNRKEDVIDLDDLKKLFKEYIMMKMEEDF